MKRYQKVLALLLISLMALSLSGCSLITITKTASNMNSLKSVSADLALNLNMDMTMMDETSPLEIAVSGPFDFDLANGKGKADLTLDLMGENVDLLLYYERLEDKFVIYTSADNGETGTETVHGKEAVIYSGNILWEDLAGDVDLSSAAEAAGSASGMPLDFSDLDLTALGSIPVTIGYDKENDLIVKGSADLTETVQNLIPMVMKVVMKSIAAESGMEDSAEMEDFDLSELGFTMDIQTLTVSAELYNFDAVGEITIPPEALAAEVAAAA